MIPKAFKNLWGLNGVGTKAVIPFLITSWCRPFVMVKAKMAEFKKVCW